LHGGYAGKLGSHDPIGVSGHIASLQVDLDLQTKVLIGRRGRTPEGLVHRMAMHREAQLALAHRARGGCTITIHNQRAEGAAVPNMIRVASRRTRIEG
jgi:hypothetical protein